MFTDGLFDNCSKLTQVILIGADPLQQLELHTFSNCDNLSTIISTTQVITDAAVLEKYKPKDILGTSPTVKPTIVGIE